MPKISNKYELKVSLYCDSHPISMFMFKCKTDKTKLEKIVWTANEEGNRIIVNRSLTDGDEGRFVASAIWETKMTDHVPNSDFAILSCFLIRPIYVFCIEK